MSLLEHLEELRMRLTRCIIAAVVGFAVCFAFAERILQVMLKPLKDVLPQTSTIQTTALTEGFFVSMKAAFVGGLFLVSPVIFHQIWQFIAPGLYESERKLAIPIAFFTALCFVSGACFGYFVVFPFGFTFLANYAADVFTLNPKLSEYYSLALGLLFAFGIIFEMPVFIFFLARLGVVDHKWLREKRRWAIVIFFIVAAILTPTPDAVNQILMAAPMVVLYEVSIWVAYFFGRKKPAPQTGNLPAQTDGAAGSSGGTGGAAPAGGPGSPGGDGGGASAATTATAAAAPAAAACAAASATDAPEAAPGQALEKRGGEAASGPGAPAQGRDSGVWVPPTVSDAALDEASGSGNSHLREEDWTDAPGQTTHMRQEPRDAAEAERQAHDIAALGHDAEDVPVPAGQAGQQPQETQQSGSAGKAPEPKNPA